MSLCVRLRFLIVDGCGVNHCARDDLSKRFTAMLLRPIAEKDWTNMMAVFLTKVANISLLSCQGHFMNNVAKDAMKPWLDTLIFQIWRSFKHVFFKCGKSAKKGRYGVVSLETMSECWNEETEGAVTLFEKELQQDVLRSNFLTGTLKAKQIENLSAALKILVRVTGERTTSVQAVIDIFASNASIEDKAAALDTHGQHVVEALALARSMKAVKTPALGGVTRWGFDKIVSIEFLSTQLPTVAAFALDAIKNQDKPPKSMQKLCVLLGQPNAITTAMEQAKAFLKEMEPLHKVLLKFSDYAHYPLAASVWAAIEDVRLHSVSLQTQAAAHGAREFKEAFEYHAGRLRKRHDMKFWERVRWLHPLVMEACRQSENVPTAAEMSRDLQANFDEGEWKKYCECTDFKWTRVTRHEGDWWFGIGGEMFPLMKEPAYALVWVPTVVTQCDSMLSVMGAKFNRRQAHLAPHVAANQLFMRCNWRYLLPKKESENQPDVTDSSDSSDDD